MKKLVLYTFFLFYIFDSYSQTYNNSVVQLPAGTIKDSLSAIPRIKTFNYSMNPQGFTLPADSKYCIIEAWGAGGAGGTTRGGGGGGYILLKFRNASGKTIILNVGKGGTKAVGVFQPDGGSTSISINGSTFIARGGAGDVINPSSSGGYEINISTSDPNITCYGMYGEPGKINRPSNFSNRNDTTLVYLETGGKGGNAGNTTNTGGEGNSIFILAKYNPSSSGFTKLQSYSPVSGISTLAPDNGLIPGGGGGGKAYFVPGFSFPVNEGSNGADGLIKIYY